MKTKRAPSPKVKAPNAIELNVDLAAFDLEQAQGFAGGLQLVQINVLRGGKRVTVWIDLHQHSMRAAPTMRMTVTGPRSDVTRTAQVRPWVDLADVRPCFGAKDSEE